MADPLGNPEGPPGILDGPWKPGDPVRGWTVATDPSPQTVSPSVIAIPITELALSITLTQHPPAIAIPILELAPSTARAQRPNVVIIPIALPAPSTARAQRPAAVAIAIALPAPNINRTQTMAAAVGIPITVLAPSIIVAQLVAPAAISISITPLAVTTAQQSVIGGLGGGVMPHFFTPESVPAAQRVRVRVVRIKIAVLAPRLGAHAQIRPLQPISFALRALEASTLRAPSARQLLDERALLDVGELEDEER